MEGNSLGIRKISDSKMIDGRQFYRVVWESTWEAEESLIACQHLIDDFWRDINNAKVD